MLATPAGRAPRERSYCPSVPWGPRSTPPGCLVLSAHGPPPPHTTDLSYLAHIVL